MKKIFILFIIIVSIISVDYYFQSIYVKNNETYLVSEIMPTISSGKMLNLKGSSSIIITIYPAIMEEDSFLIELFDNGEIETSVGKVTKSAFYGEFTGNKNDVFQMVKKKGKRTLNSKEAKLINEMLYKLDFSNINRKNLEKNVADDATQKMIWINNKAYYFCGTLPEYDEATDFIEKNINLSSIPISV